MAETPTPLAEIEHGPSKLEQFLEAHQKKLIAVAILIALAVVAYFVYDNKKQTEYQESGNRLVQAEEIGDYQDVVKKAPLSAAAGSAQIMISDFQWEDSQEDSIKTLRDMIDANETHPATPTAQVGLGLKLLEQGKNDEAKEVFERIIGDNSAEYIAPLAMIALGDMAKQAGEIDAAKDWYVQAGGTVPPAQSPPANAFADTASSRLALVNAKPPVKIKPAPKA
ncbi:MAG: tetratricopeptide repeat protein, partial [Akkermansiaceae bacterium]